MGNGWICGGGNRRELTFQAGVGSDIFRSTIFAKNSTLLRSNLLKRVVFDRIEKSPLLKIVVFR